jgi:coproporphyrinogen III oxidase-like Fe-S oxidoreductase
MSIHTISFHTVQQVDQLHFVGGTLTYLSAEQMGKLMQHLLLSYSRTV